MKKLIKSRRGVAIELAIGVMFVLMAFTVMLISTAGLQNQHRNEDYKEYMEMMEVNNVGEYVVANRFEYAATTTLNPITGEDVPEGYSVLHIGNNKFEIYRVEGESKELVLTIEMDGNTITSWK